MVAYGVRPYQVSGPGWLGTEKYDIAAKIPSGTTAEQLRVMLQNLLAERFHLVLHHETREISAYVLSVGKNGSKLKESAGKSTPAKESLPPAFRQLPPQALSVVIAGGFMTTRTRIFMAGQERPASWIAETLQTTLGRPVVDRTGLTGKYDYYFDFAPEQRVPGAEATTDASDPAPSVFTAVQELGLRLEEKNVPFDTVVIDQGNKLPTEN